MKVCRVSQTYPTLEFNGKGQHCYNTTLLSKQPSLIITRDYQGETYYPTPENAELYRVSYPHYTFPAKNKLSFNFIKAVLYYVIGQLIFLFKSIRKVLQFKPDIVHLQSPHAILIGLAAKLLIGSKLVITFHGSDLRRIKKLKLYALVLSLADRIFYVDANMRTDLLNLFPKKQLIHTPSGIDISFFTPATENKGTDAGKYFVSVGNLRWQKNYPMLIKAYSMFSEKHPDYLLKIIGEGPDRSEIETLIKNLNLTDKVELLGNLPKEKVLHYLQSAYCFSLSSSTEGLPKALVEALACELPILVTEVGSCKELSENVGLCVKSEDANSFATAMSTMVEDKELYLNFKKNTRKKSLNYTWENLTNIIYKEFDTLLER